MGENSQKGKSLFPSQYFKSLNIYSNYLKSTSYVTKHLPELKNSESNQQRCQNSKFKVNDYLSCSCKILTQNCFGAYQF